jgi:DNA-binding transcriptional MerR regulator
MAAGSVILSLGEELGGLRAAGGSARHIPPKLYRISEIVEYSGVSRQTIHNYTTMGLITEARRTPGGHRLYEEGVFARLDAIESLKRQRKSLREIRAQLATLNPNAQ